MIKKATDEDAERVAKQLGVTTKELRKRERERHAAYRLLDEGHPVGSMTPAELRTMTDAIEAEHRAEGTRRSAKSRKARNADRGRRIHDRANAGDVVKAIAADEDVSVDTVYRDLKKPRP